MLPGMGRGGILLFFWTLVFCWQGRSLGGIESTTSYCDLVVNYGHAVVGFSCTFELLLAFRR